MVDGVVLLCDAAEGPKSQTKYVLTRALALGLKPLVVLNKCDRPDAIASVDSGETESRLIDLFTVLGANDDQMNYRTLYASAREGWITEDPLEALEIAEKGYDGDSKYSMHVLLNAIMEEIPEPAVRSFLMPETDQEESMSGETFAGDQFSLAATTVGFDQYLGRTCTGRIFSGSLTMNDSVIVRKPDANVGDGASSLVSGVFVYEGISRVPLVGTAYAGDIVTVAGVPDSIAVGDTLTCSKNPVLHAIDTPPLAPPTLAMDFGANDGILAGSEGTKIASSQIRDRLISETDNNVTLKAEICETDSDKTTVYARGELQLGILVETMRREGFEMVISPPRILTRTVDGKVFEPYEEVTVDVDTEFSSTVVSSLTGDRKGIFVESDITSDDKSRLIFHVPSRGLLGFSGEVATATKGSAVVNHLFLEDREYAGSLGNNLEKGKLVSTESGKATSFALQSISQRGKFLDPTISGLILTHFPFQACCLLHPPTQSIPVW
jgi:GTP-binding protein